MYICNCSTYHIRIFGCYELDQWPRIPMNKIEFHFFFFFFEAIDGGINNAMQAYILQVMGHLLAVKEKLTTTENLFEPLQETMELLKTYGQELSDEVHQQLQVHTSPSLCNIGPHVTCTLYAGASRAVEHSEEAGCADEAGSGPSAGH